ncbi:MAG: hypothetical protein JWM91_4248, partial [Rhodospirillales bacterium]|nr:hypothetical protein [Rhodospirillales bacterium]
MSSGCDSVLAPMESRQPVSASGSGVEIGAFSARVIDIRNLSRPCVAHGNAAMVDGAHYEMIFNTGPGGTPHLWSSGK